MPELPAPRPISRGVAWGATVLLTVPAALNTASHLLTPVTSASLPQAVSQAAAHPQRALWAALLPFALPVLGVGLAVLAWRASAAAPRLATWGAAFLAGGYLLSNLSVDDLLGAVLSAHTSPITALAALNGFDSSAAGQFSILAVVGQAPGLILLGVALWRSRAVPRPLAACFMATLPLHLLTHSFDSTRLPAVSWAWYTVVLVGCGVTLLRATSGARLAHDASLGGWSTAPVAGTINA